MTDAASLAGYFSDLPDPRIVAKCDHLLLDIVLIAICASIAGANDWEEIALFGQAKERWLKQFLPLPNGIPSPDTFERVFNKLDPHAFQQRFVAWVQGVFEVGVGQVVPIDGKTVCATRDQQHPYPLHIVSAWASETGITLGQVKVMDKSNEISAIPELLQIVDVRGCIVTLDALGCQQAIAEAIVAQGADYILAVKSNQGTLYQHVETLFAMHDDGRFRQFTADYADSSERGHGRIEQRQCWAMADQHAAQMGWQGCQSVVRMCRHRTVGTATESATVYYISTLPPHAQRLLQGIRAHWGIENGCHWVLDLAFQEDRQRSRVGHAAENLTLLRKIALNALKQHVSTGSVKGKRYRAGLDEDYLLQVLQSSFFFMR